MSGPALRIGMVTTFYPPYHFGGDAIAVQRLSRALVRAGHHVTVVHDVDAYHALGGTLDGARDSGSTDEGVSLIRLQSRHPVLSSLLTQQVGRPVMHGRRLRRILQHNFDVINFHNISLVGGPGVLAMGRAATRVYMAHEHWLVCPTHVLWRFRRELCDERHCVRCQLSYRRPPQVWRATGTLSRALEHVDAFIAMSAFSRDKHREFGFPREMEVLPAFLPASSTSGAGRQAERPHARPYFLFVGRLEAIKGIDDLIACASQYPEADVLIAGVGDHEAALRRASASNARVAFLGHVTPDALQAYYLHALALVVPSRCFETFGLGVIEAFQSGTPVIARRLGPFPEVLQGGGGVLFSTLDELRAAMRRVQFEPGLRESLARSAIESFRDHFTDVVVVPKYLDILRRAGERAARRPAAAG